MKKGRMILHSDLNSFYASVEIMQQPHLKGQAVAVCGSADDRHGIVLAKSERAKKAGIKTGMANWQAKRLCPDLIMVAPRFHEYVKYSRAVREIYSRFSKKIEPYGMDECWIDISPICSNFHHGEEIANQIRELTKSELGLSVSIGVSLIRSLPNWAATSKNPMRSPSSQKIISAKKSGPFRPANCSLSGVPLRRNCKPSTCIPSGS